MEPHPAQVLAWLAAAATFLITALRILAELRQSREQRAMELRWKQAEAGKSLNDEMQTDERAWPAMQMLDSAEREFNVSESRTIRVSHGDISVALNPATPSDPKINFIRDCFDTLFYFFAMFDHYIRSGLIREDDVAYPLEYYVPLLAQHRAAVECYLAHYKLKRVLDYLLRHPAWSPPTGGAA